MREALDLARSGNSLPYPNPWVGAVVVRKGKIVGCGLHRGPGENHAEVEALNQAGESARGATLYVTLEPCCHYGRTPPCADAILRAGIRDVFYSLDDPNPEVFGRGGRILRAGGVRTHRGLLEREASAANEVYLKFRATGLPFVTAKVAATLDGKIATRSGESKWITGPQARARAREIRAEHQAVVVGINTILADNPHLGSRMPGRPDPWRVVLDSKLRIPATSKVIRSGRCIVACTARASQAKRRNLERMGAAVWSFSESGKVPLGSLARRLAEHGIISLLVEGGGESLGSFFDGRLVDRVHWFLSPMIVGSAESPAAVGGEGVTLLRNAWKLRDPKIGLTGDALIISGGISRWALA